MIKLITSLLFLLCFCVSNMQAQLLFQKRYQTGSAYATVINSIAKQSDSTFITAGSLIDSMSNQYAHIMFIDSAGDVQWEKDYLGMGDKIIRNIDGSFTIGGPGFGSINYSRIDESGNLIAANEFNIPYYTALQSLLATKDSGNLLIGSIRANGGLNAYGYAIKLDNMGQVQWMRKYSSNVGSTVMNDAIENADGSFYLFGTTTDFDTINFYADIILLHTDSIGRVMDTKMIQTPDVDDVAFRFFKNGKNGFLFALASGAFNPPFFGTEKILMETDSNFNQLWGFKYHTTSGPGIELFSCAELTSDKGIIFSDGSGFIKVDSIGNLEWKKNVYSIYSQGYHAIQEVMNGYIAVGNTSSTIIKGFAVKIEISGEAGCNQNTNGLLIIDTTFLAFQPTSFNDSLITFPLTPITLVNPFNSTIYTDCYGTVSINELTNTNVDDYTIYPNPFNNEIQIKLKKGSAFSATNISLINNLGEIIQTDVSQSEETAMISVNNLSAGIYFLKILRNGKAFYKKLIKI